jgi:hypothetical protein
MTMVEARAAWAGLAGTLLLASACTMGPDFAPPSAAITPSATQASADALLAGGAKVEARWRHSLGDRRWTGSRSARCRATWSSPKQ